MMACGYEADKMSRVVLNECFFGCYYRSYIGFFYYLYALPGVEKC